MSEFEVSLIYIDTASSRPTRVHSRTLPQKGKKQKNKKTRLETSVVAVKPAVWSLRQEELHPVSDQLVVISELMTVLSYHKVPSKL